MSGICLRNLQKVIDFALVRTSQKQFYPQHIETTWGEKSKHLPLFLLCEVSLHEFVLVVLLIKPANHNLCWGVRWILHVLVHICLPLTPQDTVKFVYTEDPAFLVEKLLSVNQSTLLHCFRVRIICGLCYVAVAGCALIEFQTLPHGREELTTKTALGIPACFAAATALPLLFTPSPSFCTASDILTRTPYDHIPRLHVVIWEQNWQSLGTQQILYGL